MIAAQALGHYQTGLRRGLDSLHEQHGPGGDGKADREQKGGLDVVVYDEI